MSALAASDTDEEDHESTPVITTTNGNNENKPTAPLEAVDEKGNCTVFLHSGLKNPKKVQFREASQRLKPTFF